MPEKQPLIEKDQCDSPGADKSDGEQADTSEQVCQHGQILMISCQTW